MKKLKTLLLIIPICVFLPLITKAEIQYYGYPEAQAKINEAQQYCLDLNYNGYDDWILANKSEINNLAIIEGQFGVINDNTNWCYNQDPIQDGWYLRFDDRIEGEIPLDRYYECADTNLGDPEFVYPETVWCSRNNNITQNNTPDIDLVNTFASSTTIITDNKGIFINFIIITFTAVLVISLVIVALSWAIGKIKKTFKK